jgi:hypothetical protein
MSERGICSVFSSERFDGSFTKTCHHHRWQQPDRCWIRLGKTICFESLKFTVDRFGNPSLSPEGNDSVIVFIGMVHSGSPSLHIILEESYNKGDTASGGGGSSGLPGPRGCNVVTLIVPIATTPSSESTPVLLTIPTTPLRTATPQPGTGLLSEQQQSYQEEQQSRAHDRQVHTERGATEWQGERDGSH